ncbi:MAG: hypothetical protein RL326_978 [Pseudomonadota bacterium]
MRAMEKGLLRIILFLGVNLVTALSSIRPVHADDYISPDLVKVTTPLYRRNKQLFHPKLGVYEYSVGWEGINAASCAVTVSKKDGTYIVDAAARTYTGVDLLYKLRYEAIGTISAEDFSSISLSIDHRENSRKKNIEMSFQPGQGQITATRGKGADDPDKKTVSFSPNNLTLDPIGAAFLARSLEWNIGDTKHFDVFNGKSRYFISLSAIRRETITYKGEKRPVIVISPQVRNLTTTKPRAKLREAFIYVSDDQDRDVLRIVSSVFIGSVITELDSFTPRTKLANPLELVQANSDTDARAQMR